MTCPSADELIDFAAARLVDDRKRAITAHAADCAQCRVALSDLARPEGTTREGNAIGRYVIVARIGRGAMGVVYRARDPQLERDVAVKLLHRRIADGEPLLDEARTLARISHPRVVTVFDAGVHDGRPFIVMELVDGMTLRQWLATTSRGWRQTLPRLIDAGEGLAAVHAASIVHGDFKPENVLVDAHDGVRVTDFGLARSGTAVASAGGTPAYMAPEQLERGVVDDKSDQFSYCVTLFEALFGARPFSGASVSELRESLRRPPQLPDARAPKWLSRIALRGLSLDPRARFPSLPALLREIRRRRHRTLRRTLSLVAAALTVTMALLIRNELPSADRTCRIEARRLAEPDSRDDAARRDYLRRWLMIRVGVCEDATAGDAATHSRFSQRIACLDRLRRDARTVAPADLPSPESCNQAR